MNSIKKNHELIRQNESRTKKPQKHDSNLQKNSTLYFQIGLILSLFVTYGLFQMTFKTKTYAAEVVHDLPQEDLYVYNETYAVHEEQPEKQQETKRSYDPYLEPDVVDNNDDSQEESEIFPQTTSDEPVLDPGSVTVYEPPVDLPPMNVMLVEQVPIFPGCEYATSNEERRECLSQKMSKFVQKKFNTDLAQDLGLSGIQRINVLFKIDKNGHVVDIKSRAPHPQLEKEANKVIEKLPQMTPGKHGEKNVEVLYALPIRFDVRN